MPRRWASSRAPAHGLGRAAARLAVVLGIGPQLERARDASPSRGDEQRGDGAVHAAAHRDERAVPRRRASAAWRAAAPRARWSASAASWAAWSFEGISPPSSSAISRQPIRAASSRPRPRASATVALPAALRGAAAARVEAGVGDRPAGVVERERQAHEVAAGRAAGGAGESARRDVPATERRLEVFAQLF